jgi:hypothetical protein
MCVTKLASSSAVAHATLNPPAATLPTKTIEALTSRLLDTKTDAGVGKSISKSTSKISKETTIDRPASTSRALDNTEAAIVMFESVNLKDGTIKKVSLKGKHKRTDLRDAYWWDNQDIDGLYLRVC